MLRALKGYGIQALVAQLERDSRMVDLVGTMDDVYDIVDVGEDLRETEPYKSGFKTMAMQTLEFGHFLKEYVKDDFRKCSYDIGKLSL